MPPPATNDWPAVQATAVALNSIKLAAERHGVSYEAARMRAHREEWPVGQRPAKTAQAAKEVAQAQLVKVSPRAVTAVTTTVDALVATLADRHKQTKLGLSKWAVESSDHLSTLKGEEAAAGFQQAVGTASVMGKIWPEQAVTNVRLSMFAQPALDVDAQYVPDPE